MFDLTLYLCVTCYVLCVACCVLRVMCCVLCFAFNVLCVVCCVLRFMCYVLCVTFYVLFLRLTFYVLRLCLTLTVEVFFCRFHYGDYFVKYAFHVFVDGCEHGVVYVTVIVKQA